MHQITLRDFIARPEREDDKLEKLIEGERIVSPSAQVWHAAIVRRFAPSTGRT